VTRAFRVPLDLAFARQARPDLAPGASAWRPTPRRSVLIRAPSAPSRIFGIVRSRSGRCP
jgi:hypothetical protein